MPAPDDLTLLTAAARQAGEIAARHWKRDPDVWHKPGEAGPVTEADIAVDRMLREELTAARPDYGWLSEETPDGPARLAADRVFIVDPIDGTRAFIDGSRSFAHSLAVAEQGRVTAAVVYMPMLDRLYAAALGQGATLNAASLTASTADEEADAQILATKPNLFAKHWPGGVPPVSRHFRSSLAYRLALVGEGRFDGMITLRDTWEWDIAAGALIATEAGAAVTDRFGQPLRFNRARPLLPGVLAASPGIHRRFLARLSPAA